MSYYKDIQLANKFIDEELLRVKNNNESITWNTFLLSVTADFPVSQKHIIARVNMHEKTGLIKFKLDENKEEIICRGDKYDS